MKYLDQCPICLSKDKEIAFSHKCNVTTIFNIETCNTCAHNFINPQPDAIELQKYYTDDYDSWDFGRISEQVVCKEVEKAKRDGALRHLPIGPGVKLLDFGCGAGQFLTVATRLGADALGIDQSKKTTEQLRANGLNTFCGTLDDYLCSGEPQYFDIISSNHVFEHLHDPVSTLRKLGERLKPGGFIWIGVPNAANWGFRVLRGHWGASQIPFHIHHFTPKSMKAMIDRSGMCLSTLGSESKAHATGASIRIFLRHYACVPLRISNHLPWLKGFSSFLGKKLDERMTGDAILAKIIQK